MMRFTHSWAEALDCDLTSEKYDCKNMERKEGRLLDTNSVISTNSNTSNFRPQIDVQTV
jgi:hypothetical protein